MRGEEGCLFGPPVTSPLQAWAGSPRFFIGFDHAFYGHDLIFYGHDDVFRILCELSAYFKLP